MRSWNVLVLSVVLGACALDSGDGSNSGGNGGNAGSAGSAGVGGGAGAGGTSGVGGGDLCGLPFDIGPCDAAIPVWAFVPELGACFPHVYGGCGGNDNRFSGRFECEAACLKPNGGACPPNRVLQEICLACGPAGGCAESVVTCALSCADDLGCASSANVNCADGVCQMGFCD